MHQVILAASSRRIAVVCLVTAALLCACERVWYLTVIAVADGRPEFCISRYSGCRGEGVQLTLVVVSTVDASGKSQAQVWKIHPMIGHDQGLRHIAYGVLPQGWVEDSPAAPLNDGTFYSVNGQFFFQLSGQQRARLYSFAEFSRLHAGAN